MPNLKQQGVKAFFWDFSGKMATQGVGLIISIFLARLLEPEEFGLVAMIMVIIGMANVFGDVGLGSALIQRRKVLAIHYSSVFYFNIFVGLLLTLATYFSAGWIAAFYQNDALIPLTQAMSLSFVVNAFSSVQTTKLRKDLNYAALSKANFLASFTGGTLGIWLAFHGEGVWSLVAQSLASSFVFNVLIWSMSQWSPSLLFSVKALTQLWGFGFRMFFAELLNALFVRLDYLIIGKLFMPITLGYFQRAKALNSMAVQFSSESLMSVLFPLLSKVKSDLSKLQTIVNKMMGIICFIVFFLLGGLYSISEELIILLFGEKWQSSVDYFKLLVFSGFGYPISALFINVLASRGNSKSILRIQIYKNIINVLNFCVGFFWGIQGYLYGLVIATSFNVMINIYAASREVDLPFYGFGLLIIDQTVIALTSVVSMQYIITFFDVAGLGFLFMIKGFLYSILYILMSRVLNTYSYQSFSAQLLPLIRKMAIT